VNPGYWFRKSNILREGSYYIVPLPRFTIRSTLMMVVTILCISVIISISYFSYTEAENRLFTTYERELQMSENLFTKSSLYIHRGLKLWDSSFNDDLERDMQSFISAYNKSGSNPALMNFSDVIAHIDPIYRDKIDLYLINSSGVIEYTTDEKEYLLDFKKWPDFFERITQIQKSGKFIPDEIVKSFIPGSPLRKYVYQTTPDHRYIAQISLNVQNSSEKERAELSYGSLTSYVMSQDPNLISLHVIGSMGNVVIGKKDYQKGRLDPDSAEISQNVFKTHERVAIPNQSNRTVTTYIYVPNAVEETPSAPYMNLVGKFVFSTRELEQQLINNLLIHLLLVLLASFFTILIARFISYRLTSPLNQLVREIDLIAEGNLNQQISPTRHPELGRIADAVRTMVDHINRIIKDLQASESRYRSLFNTATDGILILDDDLIIDANPAGNSIFSEQDIPIAGMYLSDVCPPASEFIRHAKSRDTVSTQECGSASFSPLSSVCEADIRFGEREEYSRILNIRVIPLGLGEYPLYQAQIRDVTQRVEMEEAIKNLNVHLEKQVKDRTAVLEATIADLDSFTYTVSHDLRAPLRAIDGNAYILEMKGGDLITSDLSRYLTKIHENIKKMDNLIDDLLKFSRMSRKPLEKTEINMNNLVREVIDELVFSISGRRIGINIDDLPVTYGDPALIRQVLVNIISNALKFGKKETINEINISARTENGRVWYLIKDNGTGFNMEYADRIFDVFVQLHPAGTYEGTGVGLAIVKRIIFRHQGSIRAQSEEGVGSVFMFTLDREEKTVDDTSFEEE
jgi:signal transduction histidine kinase